MRNHRNKNTIGFGNGSARIFYYRSPIPTIDRPDNPCGMKGRVTYKGFVPNEL